jgi:hypothetical protein
VSRLPETSARAAPENLAVLLREPLLAITDHIHARLAKRGHPEVRPTHGAVFQFLDDDRGREAVPVAQEAIAELEGHWTDLLGERDMKRLRGLLQRLNEAAAPRW